MEVQKVLTTYEVAVGQGINKHKSGVFFNSNTCATAKTSILIFFGVSVCKNSEKYLGLPMLVGRNKYRNFEKLKDQDWGQIMNWKHNFLSQARKKYF